MNWPDERYVRLYTRDTLDWKALGWEARALFCELLRKADRSGVLQVQHDARRVVKVAALVDMPRDVVERALAVLIEDGCLTESALGYSFRNYIAAQEAEPSDAQRQRDSRERRAAKGQERVRAGGRDEWVDPERVTARDPGSPVVTTGHTEGDGSQNGSLRAVPSRAEPCRTNEREASLVGELEKAWNANRGDKLLAWGETTTSRQRLAETFLSAHPVSWFSELVQLCARDPWHRGEIPDAKTGRHFPPKGPTFLLDVKQAEASWARVKQEQQARTPTYADPGPDLFVSPFMSPDDRADIEKRLADRKAKSKAPEPAETTKGSAGYPPPSHD